METIWWCFNIFILLWCYWTHVRTCFLGIQRSMCLHRWFRVKFHSASDVDVHASQYLFFLKPSSLDDSWDFCASINFTKNAVFREVRETSRRNNKVHSTQRTRHILSRLLGFTILLDTFQTERVNTRKYSRISERLTTNWTFRYIVYLFKKILWNGHFDVRAFTQFHDQIILSKAQ